MIVEDIVIWSALTFGVAIRNIVGIGHGRTVSPAVITVVVLKVGAT